MQTYKRHENVEGLWRYERGGYHPTDIGDMYHGRYEIIHKLFHGFHCTVWLVRDHHAKRYAALKILTANFSQFDIELRVLRALNKGDPDHPGRAHVISLLDSFKINGPNGRHLCMVFESCGFSVAESKDEAKHKLLPVHLAKVISTQAMLALDYIHSCGVVHGNLQLGKMLLKTNITASASTDEIYRSITEPKGIPLKGVDGDEVGPEYPKYRVFPAKWEQAADDLTEPHIMVIDFSMSFLEANGALKYIDTPEKFMPPEYLFKESFGKPVDVWTLGCSLFEILGDRPLFPSYEWHNNGLIAKMIIALGEIPQRWWDKWKSRSQFFLGEDQSLLRKDLDYMSLYEPLTVKLGKMGRNGDPQMCEISPAEMALIEQLLRTMLTFEPSKRITASELLKSAWVVGWGEPAVNEQNEGWELV